VLVALTASGTDDANSNSIGGFYAFILGNVDNIELSVVARSNYDSVKHDVRNSRFP
jgi:hypothetical protein